MRPLDGIRVLDTTIGPVGGIATMVLADFGADVLKIEPPGGDPLRRLAASPLWLRGKRSAALDLGAARGAARLRELCRSCDVLVTTLPPGQAGRLGLDHESLAAEHPSLIHCAITGWGPLGPYAGYPGWDALVAAKSRRMTSFAGQRARAGPGFAALPVASHAAAQGAVVGICSALLAREQSGRGSRVETSLLQAVGLYDLFQLLTVQLRRRGGDDTPPVPVGGMPTLNYHPVMARDGRWIQLGNLLEHLFYAFLDATDLLPELMAEERFQGAPDRWTPDAIEEARDRILVRMQERPADEWMEIFRRNGNVAAEPFGCAQDALDHPDMIANGDIVERSSPRLGRIREIGAIAKLTETPGRPGQTTPTAGEHEPVWLERPGAPETSSSSASSPRTGAPLPGTRAAFKRGAPLQGLTIVDLSTIIAAPLAASILADLGARVIKLEPLTGDPYRHLGFDGVLAAKTTAGKESLCVDLKHPEGQRIAHALCQGANAVLHNFRPGVAERLGVGYDQLRQLRPDIVWVAATGYGPDAPSANRPATHPIPGAATGGALLQAGAATPPDDVAGLPEVRETARQLMRANEPNPDPNTSAVIASATALALLAQRRGGVGQAVYVDMFTANAYANADDFLCYAGKPPRATVDAEIHGYGPTYRLYATGEGWVFLAAPDQAAWEGLCERADWRDLAGDPRFRDAEHRGANAEELAGELERRLRSRSADAWEALLAPAGVGCVRADGGTPGTFFADDPHVRENGFAPEVTHARFGEMQRWGALVSLDGGRGTYGGGVLAGEHTDAILSELGLAPGEIARLRADRVVGSEERGEGSGR